MHNPHPSKLVKEEDAGLSPESSPLTRSGQQPDTTVNDRRKASTGSCRKPALSSRDRRMGWGVSSLNTFAASLQHQAQRSRGFLRTGSEESRGRPGSAGGEES